MTDGWRPRARAVVVALHLLAISLMAVPAPSGGLSRSAWKDPTVQGELKAWTGRLNALGLSITQAELETRAFSAAVEYERGRQWVLAPFMPYYRYCGTWQSWRMFVAPHRYPSRLHIDVLEQGQWRPVYVARSTEHAWRARQFDHDRMRATIFRFGWKHFRRHYKQFAAWVAREAAVDFPDADKVRLRFYKYRTASPEEVRSGTEPEGKFGNTLERSLSELR